MTTTRMKTIDEFTINTAFLSNFYPAPVTWAKRPYPTTEHAYQAVKTHDKRMRERIALAHPPGAAKRLGREVELRPDWETVKLKVMWRLLRRKFRYAELREKLLATGNARLIEGNYWHDNYWGNCTCSKCEKVKGENHLGRLLMKLRARLRKVDK